MVCFIYLTLYGQWDSKLYSCTAYNYYSNKSNNILNKLLPHGHITKYIFDEYYLYSGINFTQQEIYIFSNIIRN